MIASLPIEATRARFQTRPSNRHLPAATIAAFRLQREVGGTEELGKELIRPIRSCRAVRRSIALNGDAVGRQPMQSRRRCLWKPTPPLANLRVSLHPELGTLGTSASIPSRRVPLEAAEHH